MFHFALAEERREDAGNILFYLKNPPRLAFMERGAAKRLAVYENMLKKKAAF
jgi:hypothetical protein